MKSTLRRRMLTNLALVVSGSLLMGISAVVGVNGVHSDLSTALDGNRQLRQIYEIGSDVETAKRSLSSAHPDQASASVAIETALAHLDSYDYTAPNTSPAGLDAEKKAEVASRLRDAARVDKNQLTALNAILGELVNLSSEVRESITARERSAEVGRRHTLMAMSALCLSAVLIAIAIGVRQYRSVMGPVDRIALGVRRFAGGRFGERIVATGDREFVELANDFNSMAAELEGLYRTLEEKVAAKSRELVRSERLASVGYLAAGVAHEMNNPLGIIAGYGERSLQHLARGLDSNTLPSAQRAIQIMCEEAFRCKEITSRLLSLARPGNEHRSPVSIPAMIEEVISNLGVLPEYADRRITLESPAKASLMVLGNDGELRQVVLNLMLNALQATLPKNGEVRVSLTAVDQEVEISVRDNGCGMTPGMVEKVFEPFFTEKRGQQRPGTGLGLSITHAIVLDHGGRIEAQSAGPGTGSRFTVRLPALAKGAEVADFPTVPTVSL